MGNVCSPNEDNSTLPDMEAKKATSGNVDAGSGGTNNRTVERTEVPTKGGEIKEATTPQQPAPVKKNSRFKAFSSNKKKSKLQTPSQDGGQDQAPDRGEKLRELENQLLSLNQQLLDKKAKLDGQNATIEKQEAERAEKHIQLREEQQRVAKLKLQTALRDKELAFARQQSGDRNDNTTTYIEGRLFKFGRGGKQMNPKEKWVQVHLLSSGQVVVDYCENWRSSKIDRNEIVLVENGEKFLSGNLDYYKGLVFAVKCAKNDRIMVFSCDNEQERTRWKEFISRALEDRPDEMEKAPERVVFEYTFEKRPLGFGVDLDKNGEKLIVTSIQKTELDLTENLQVISANGQDFDGMTRQHMMDVLKFGACPLTIRFAAGPKELENLPGFEASATSISRKHRATPSMQDLYGDQAISNDILSHPLVKNNVEFQTWVQNPEFHELLEDLTKYPEKLEVYLNSDL